MTYRDVGYARISKDDLRQGRGVARQTEAIERRSTETGGHLVAMLSDNDISASRYSTKKRVDYPKLLAMAGAGEVDRIIVYRLDRLLRIPDELEALIKVCERRKLTVVNLHGSMDLTTAEGRKYARDRVSDAAYESDLISERTRFGFDQMAAEGRPHSGMGGARAFGYEPDGLTIRPDEADLIRTAAKLVLAGEPLNEIARRWNTAGHRTARRGAMWTNQTVRQVITGPRAAGLRIHRRGTDEEKTYPASWPAIIDEPTHRALVRHLTPGSTRRPGRRTEFTGLFVAVVDGEQWPMRRDRNRSTPVYRTYSNFPGTPVQRVQVGPAGDLEALVRELLFTFVESGDLARTLARRRADQTQASTVERVSDVEAELAQLAQDEANHEVTRIEWLAKRKILVPRLRAAQAAEDRSSTTMVLDGVDADIRERWKRDPADGGFSVDRKAAILREMFVRVEIAPAVRMGPGFDASRVNPVWR